MPVASAPILLVEDDPNAVFLLENGFRSAKVTCPLQVVGDGDAAVAYLAGDAPYTDRSRYPLPVVILLDLHLPRRSGLDVLDWMRRQEGLKRLPVVVLTSSSDSSDVNRAYDLGANSYLVKPVTFDALLDMLSTLSLYWLVFNAKPEVAQAAGV